MNFEEEIVGLKERKSELKGQIRSLDDEIQTFLILKDSGFETERTFEGKSGVKHTFNAYNPSNKCAVDWYKLHAH